MKRFAALVLCLALFLTALPLSAMAGDAPKIAFTNYYLGYFDQSIEVQEFFMQALTQNTIKFKLDANLLSSNVVLDDGTTLSNVPGNASVALAFNFKDREAALDFKSEITKYDVQGKIFFTEQGMIIPRETIKALAANGASFSELGNLNQLPDYIVYPSEISSSDWDELEKQIQLAQSQSKDTAAIRALLQEILYTIPDQCYYYSGSDPVLDLTKISLDSPELLTSLKSHSEILADKVVAAMNNSGNLSQQEFLALKENTRTEIISTINGLTARDMQKLASDIPVDLEKCRIAINGSHSQTDFALKANLPDNSKIYLGYQTTASVSSGTTSSLLYGDFTLRSSEVNIAISLNGDSSVNKSKGQFDLNLTGSGTDKKTTISGKLGLNGSLDWSSTAGVSVPKLTSSNSKTVTRTTNLEQPIRVYLDGREIYFTGKTPWISEGDTLVQLSSLVQALGCTVDWQPPDTIMISNGSNEELTLYLGSTSYFIGGQAYQSNAVPAIIDGRTYIPLRVLAEYYNLTVEWNAATSTINLTHQN